MRDPDYGLLVGVCAMVGMRNMKKPIVYICLLLSLGCYNYVLAGEPAPAKNQTLEKYTISLENLFKETLTATGSNYLEHERKLVAENSLPVLESHLNDPDPLTRLIAKALINAKTEPGHNAAMHFLDTREAYYKPTVSMFPSPAVVGSSLVNRYGNTISDYLSVRLLKEKPSPRWRMHTILYYLEKAKNPSTTIALIHFAAESEDEVLVKAAASAIKEIKDPELAPKLKAARKKIEEQGGKWPSALDQLDLDEKK